MELSMDKYRFYTSKNKVVAVSTYAGRPVRGVAKCDPIDAFSLEVGKELAAARCNDRVAEKRLKRAQNKLAEATDALIMAQRQYEKMKQYVEDAQEAYVESANYVSDMLDKLN